MCSERARAQIFHELHAKLSGGARAQGRKLGEVRAKLAGAAYPLRDSEEAQYSQSKSRAPDIAPVFPHSPYALVRFADLIPWG